MEVIKIKGTDDTPNVILDAGSNVMEFSGRSLPEDVVTFYAPVIEWIEEYSKSPNAKTEVIFRLEYFNTASSKILLDILLKFEDIHNNGNEVVIQWYFQEDDEDMEEAGEEYSEIVDIPFEMHSY
jgi:alpha-amylase/alpha-mannosidase (GH57 family)